MLITRYDQTLESLLRDILKDIQMVYDDVDATRCTFEYQGQFYVAQQSNEVMSIVKTPSRSTSDLLTRQILLKEEHKDQIYQFQHTQVIDLKRHLYYFFLNAQRFRSIVIDRTHICLTIQYSYPIGTMKEQAHDKRVHSNIDLLELKYLMMLYKDGYVLSNQQGRISITNRKEYVLQGFGYDYDENLAMKKALLEYLERCAASYPLKDAVRGSYEELMDHGALDAKIFGVYDDEVLQRVGKIAAQDADRQESGTQSESSFGLVKYSPNLVLDWVKAQSLLTKREYLIPEQLVQYLRKDLFNRYVFESSNGCALGNSFAEATFYSILEVIERDLFMKAWFYKQPLKKIRFTEQQSLKMSGKQLYFAEQGYSLSFYYIENPMNLPVVWCLVQSENEENLIYSMTGLGCHLHVEDAIEAAFFEAYKSFTDILEHDQDIIKQKIERIENSQEINDVIEHIEYFLSYKSKTVIEGVTEFAGEIDYEDLVGFSFDNQDLQVELEELLLRSKMYYSDLLVVDQTNSFLEAFGLFCTKVLIVGGVPLDFTSHYIRRFPGEQECMKVARRNIHPLA